MLDIEYSEDKDKDKDTYEMVDTDEPLLKMEPDDNRNINTSAGIGANESKIDNIIYDYYKLGVTNKIDVLKGNDDKDKHTWIKETINNFNEFKNLAENFGFPTAPVIKILFSIRLSNSFKS